MAQVHHTAFGSDGCKDSQISAQLEQKGQTAFMQLTIDSALNMTGTGSRICTAGQP